MSARIPKPVPHPQVCERCKATVSWLPCVHCGATGSLALLGDLPSLIGQASDGTLHRQGADPTCPFCNGVGWIKQLHLACGLQPTHHVSLDLLWVALVFLVILLLMARTYYGGLIP